MLLLMLVLVHIGGLWLTSPPDVIDVLLFRSPTPFSVWGMVALLALLATALVTGLRKKLRLPYPQWRFIHLGLATLLVTGCIVHALKIEGTMETISKTALAAAIVVMLVRLIVGSRAFPD